MSDATKKWWEELTFSDTGANYNQNKSDWALGALYRIAIEGRGPPICNIDVSVNLNGKAKAIHDKIKDLGGVEFGATAYGWKPEENYYTYYRFDSGLVSIRGGPSSDNISLDIALNDRALAIELANFATAMKDTTPRGYVQVIANGANGPHLKTIGISGVDFEPSNYAPEAVEAYDHIIADFQSTDPCGRIAILNGEPGTGKTFMIRSMMKGAPGANFVLLPSELVSQLSGPALINVFTDYRSQGNKNPVVLVIEDADECLVPRDAGNSGAISALLNMSDGVLGHLLDIRILATTNAGHLSHDNDQNIDEAILRSGRLCKRLHVGKIPASQARAVFRRITGTDAPRSMFPEACNVADVYKAAKGWTVVKPKEHAPLGFASAATAALEEMSDEELNDVVAKAFR